MIPAQRTGPSDRNSFGILVSPSDGKPPAADEEDPEEEEEEGQEKEQDQEPDHTGGVACGVCDGLAGGVDDDTAW